MQPFDQDGTITVSEGKTLDHELEAELSYHHRVIGAACFGDT